MDESKTLPAGVPDGPVRVPVGVGPAPGARGLQGEAVQLDPIKPKLKPPGTKHSKLKCDDLVSNFAFNFGLRRYNKEQLTGVATAGTVTLPP